MPLRPAYADPLYRRPGQIWLEADEPDTQDVFEALDMGYSLVRICNMALGQCGITRQIGALDFGQSDNVPHEARMCALYFELAFRAAARGHDWKCLAAQADISGNLTTAPAAGFAYAYSLPSDYIGGLRLLSNVEYTKVGRHVQTDATSVQIEYIRYTLDTDLYDDLFVEALVKRLAAYLAPALCGEGAVAIADALVQWHERISLPQARMADAMEQSAPGIVSDTWRNARL